MMFQSYFKSEADWQVYSRGEDLYEHGAVVALREAEPGVWKAKVQGSELYRVEIEVEDGEAVSHFCTCPYDWGPVCKHLVALAFALEAELPLVEVEPEKDGPKGKLSFREELEQLANGLSREDLLEFFIEECGSRSHPLYQAFRLKFAGKLPGLPRPDFQQMVDQAIKDAERQGEWGFFSPYPMEEVIEKLLKRARQQFQEENWEETVEICTAILSEIPKHMSEVHDDIADVNDGVIEVIEVLGDLIIGEAPVPLKNEVLHYLISNLADPDHREWGLDSSYWEILMGTDLTEPASDQLNTQLEAVLESYRDKSNGREWGLERWLDRKQAFLIKMGRKEEVATYLKTYLHLPSIRMQFVDNAIQAGSYDEAKQLIQEGLKLEEKTRWNNQGVKWQTKLLEIAQLEQDVTRVRELAETLFWQGGKNFDHYQVLKSTYTAEAWKGQVEIILTRLQSDSKIRIFSSATPMAEVLTREKYWDRLWELLRQNTDDYDLIKKYSLPLLDRYPDQLPTLFAAAISHYAATEKGRPAYHQLVNMLHHLSRMEGGKQQAELLLKKFRRQYKRRPAMMEILNRFGS